MIRYAIAVVASLAILAGVFLYGVKVGGDRETATQARIDQATQQTREASQQAAAEAISQIKVTNTTIKGEVQHEIRTNTVYVDCRVPADGLRLANEALAGKRTQPAGGGSVPAARPARR